jgi:hypothetical protein
MTLNLFIRTKISNWLDDHYLIDFLVRVRHRSERRDGYCGDDAMTIIAWHSIIKLDPQEDFGHGEHGVPRRSRRIKETAARLRD